MQGDSRSLAVVPQEHRVLRPQPLARQGGSVPMSDDASSSVAVPCGPAHAPRVTLRVVIALFLIGGMAFGWSAMGRQKARKQSEAMRAVEQLGGRVYLDYQWDEGGPVENGQPPQAAWLRRLVGAEMLDRAVAVDLQSVTQPDDTVRWLLLMPYLRHVDAANVPVSDASLVTLRRMTGIEYLDLQGTQVTDAGMVHVATLPRLRVLSLAGTTLSDAGLDALARCKSLRQLDVSETPVSREAIDRLQLALPKCRVKP